MVRFNGVNHLAMATGDMDTTIRFWRDLLGMRLVAGLGQPGYRHYFFQISDYDLIAFFEWPGVTPVAAKRPRQAGPGAVHLRPRVIWRRDRGRPLGVERQAGGRRVSRLRRHRPRLHTFHLQLRPQRDTSGIQPQRRGHRHPPEPLHEDSAPSQVTQEGAEPQPGKWPEVTRATPEAQRVVYPGAGSELFHGKR